MNRTTSEIAKKKYDIKRQRAATPLTTPAKQGKSNLGDVGDGIAKWGNPMPLSKMPPVPPFPLDVFPHKIASYWRHAAAALSVPPDYVAVPGLALLGAAAGRSIAASIKSSYSEEPCFWTAVLAPPGSTKSASLSLARAPFTWAEAKWIDQHREAVGIFDVEMDRHNAKVKEWKANGCEGEAPTKPRRPTLKQVTLDDTTVEAVAKVLNDNHRGVTVVKDELIAFVKSLNQYRKGADREFYLSGWAGAPIKVNRSGNHDAGPIFVSRPFIAITGMVCPDLLAELRGDNHKGEANADGFLDRFLLSFPDPADAVPETYETIPEEVKAGYVEVFQDLLGRELVSEADSPTSVKYRPYFVNLSSQGRLAWEEFTGAIAEKMNALDPFDPFRGVLRKLRGYAARFAALLWGVGRACGDIEEDRPIEPEVIAGANELVHYFEKHAARCWGRGWADRPTRVAKRLLSWLSREPERTGFSRREAFQRLKDERDVKTSEALEPVFKLLTDHNYIRPTNTGMPGIRTGPVSEVYVVNRDWDRGNP
jgi:hypothetical protein